ncbi:MAG: aldose epimerase family protein [Eubacteriales bacterium]|nr:aldose epimerase family protein [Eubacteriales bacterium]
MSVQPKDFGISLKGDAAKLYTLANGNCTAVVSDYGATLVSFSIQKDAETIDILLGFNSPAEYVQKGGHHGATIGRSANRIGGPSFCLNGKEYVLADNDSGRNLHSGPDLWDIRLWETDGVSKEGDPSITFRLFSPDGDQGYPGNMHMAVTYTLSEDGSLSIRYQADTDADTLCNPTNHSYFNLNGEGSGDILDHELTVYADSITPINDNFVPYGVLMPVEGTPFDFRTAKPVGRDIDSDHEQIVIGGGYDHNFALAPGRHTLSKAVELYSPQTGLLLEVSTDLPGIQVYSGNFLKGAVGKSGKPYNKRFGIALETQYYPNSINVENYASPILKAGETFTSETIYRLSVR